MKIRAMMVQCSHPFGADRRPRKHRWIIFGPSLDAPDSRYRERSRNPLAFEGRLAWLPARQFRNGLPSCNVLIEPGDSASAKTVPGGIKDLAHVLPFQPGQVRVRVKRVSSTCHRICLARREGPGV